MSNETVKQDRWNPQEENEARKRIEEQRRRDEEQRRRNNEQQRPAERQKSPEWDRFVT